MSELTLNKFFVVFYKNIPHFKQELDPENWSEFLRKSRAALGDYQTGEKSSSDEENLRSNLLNLLGEFDLAEDIREILNPSGLKAAAVETDQTKPRRVKSVKNSIEEIIKKIREEEKTRDKLQQPDGN